MGLLVAWATIALAVPVMPAANGAPGVVGLIVVGAVATYVDGWLPRLSSQRLELALWSMTLVGVAVGLLWAPIMASQQPPPATNPTAVAAPLVVLLLAAFGLATPVRRRLSDPVALAILGCAVLAVVLAGGAYILGVPDPLIDVFYVLQEGPRGLVQGQDPYSMSFTVLPPDNPGYTDPAYHFDVFPYLPGALLLSLVTVPLGDVRWLMLLSIPVSAWFLRQTLRRAGIPPSRADLCTLGFVSYPGLLWVIREAWVEPLIVCAFFGAMWAAVSKRLNWAVVAAAVCLSVKQYAPLLLLPLWSAGVQFRRLSAAAALALAVCVPFVLWSPGDFWWDAVYFQIQAPARSDALSLNGYLMSVYGANLPGWLTLSAPLLAIAYAAWRAYRGADYATLLRLTAGSYFVLFLFNKFAFANYYFLLQSILLLAAGLTPTRARADTARAAA